MGTSRLTKGYTTLYVEECGEWWMATQDGVDIIGTGESATQAVMDYCVGIEEGRDGE
jgi:hypothetical protein